MSETMTNADCKTILGSLTIGILYKGDGLCGNFISV